MRRFIVIMLTLMLGIGANAQTPEKTFEKNGATYSSVKKSSKSVEVETEFTWEDSKGNVYPIYMNQSSGSCYVKRISQKSGNEYKYYLGPEISQDICNQLGVKYTPRK